MIINPDWSNIVERIPLGNRMFCESHLVKMKEPHKSRHVSPREKNLRIQIKRASSVYRKLVKGTPYPLVNFHITMENHHFQWVNPL